MNLAKTNPWGEGVPFICTPVDLNVQLLEIRLTSVTGCMPLRRLLNFPESQVLHLQCGVDIISLHGCE